MEKPPKKKVEKLPKKKVVKLPKKRVERGLPGAQSLLNGSALTQKHVRSVCLKPGKWFKRIAMKIPFVRTVNVSPSSVHQASFSAKMHHSIRSVTPTGPATMLSLIHI